MTLSRRKLMASGALLGAAAVWPGSAMAQAWPGRPIKLVVPFPPGGLIDNMARLMAPRLAQELGQPVVIDNRPGAGGGVGASEVARAPADGYTVLMASPPLTISPALYASMPYKPEQIVPVGLVGSVPNVLLVGTRSPAATVADLIRLAKAAPGKLNYASNGNGTSLHLSAELLKSTTVRALAVTTRRRSKVLPNVPTLVESGLPDFDVSAWYGLAAPAGTPAAVVQKLEQALEKISRDADMARSMESRGAAVGFLGTAAMASFMAADAAKWKRVAAFANITLG